MHLFVNTEGAGTIEGAPTDAVLKLDERVTLTAVADDGWAFDHWEGDISENQTGSANIDVVMDSDKNLIAVFTQIQIELILDQVNEPPWDGESVYGIRRTETLVQTFMPLYTRIMGIETPVDTFEIPNVDVNLTLRIYEKDGTMLASATTFVSAGTDGWVWFDYEDGIVVEKNAHLYMVLVSDVSYVFGWKYGGDTYAKGEGYYAGNTGWGDFFFRIYGAADTTTAN